MKLLKNVFYLLLFLSVFSLKAQQYPIDIQVFVTPPYQQSLRDYWASFEPKMQVHLLLKDLNSPMRNVALRFSLENVQGQPLAQTASYAFPFQTQLSSGVRKTLSNIELKTLFAFENLQGVSEHFYNDLLPEGAYFMCFTAYDVATQMPLSAKARTLIQIRRYTPPLPTLPAKGEIISKKNQFQHLVFQWMLRDPAPFTQYEFTLKEVWDNSLSPEEAFISGRLVYQGKVPSNTILYGPDKPILLENKRYVWKVRAFTQNPNNPNQRQSFFHNEGNSETFYFDYVSHCEAPKFLTAITKDNTVNIRWSGEPPRTSISNIDGSRNLYKILYREKGKNWKSQLSNHPQATLIGLKRGRNYVYKVGVACGLGGQTQSVFSEQTYLYSSEQEFVTPHKQNDSTSVQCGVKPEIRIRNREPLQEVLGVNETFVAGDFPVTIIRATGSNGVFSGEGYVQVPYLLDTKIKVKFDGIKINSERQLFEGKLVTTYDKTEKNVQFIQEGIGEVFGDAGVKTNKIDFEIAQIKKDENGRVVVIGKPDEKTGIAPQITLPVGSDYQLSDASGKTWTLDEQGEVTSVGEKADTKLAQNQGKNNLPKGQPKPENFEIQWDFSQSAFAFDASGEIPYKALVKGKNDVFQVVIKQKDSLRYSFHFQTDKGLKVESKKEKEGVFEISRKGLFDFGDEELWVVAKNAKTEKEEVIGKCILVHLSEKEVNVTLIPTTENLQIDIDAIQRIYAKVGVKLHISADEIFLIKEKIDTKNAFGDLSTYSPEQQAIIAWYKSERATKPDTYYVFVGKQEGSQVGYMRLGGQFGFALDGNSRTIAHELGHGIFKLEHPFKKDETKKGTFRTLMDYAQETTFAYSDWKQINDPKLKIYAFQGQSEGEIAGKVWLTPDWQPFKVDDSKAIRIIRGFPKGTVPGFSIGTKKYIYKKGKYLNEKDEKDNPKIDFVIPNDVYEVRLLAIGKDACKVPVYKAKYGYVKTHKDKIVYENNNEVQFEAFWKCTQSKRNVKQSPLYKRNISREEIEQILGEGIETSSQKYKEIQQLIDFLIETLKGKEWTFLYKQQPNEDYPYHHGESLLLNVLKNREILSVDTFKENFKIIYSEKENPYYIRDIDVLIANFDPWGGVPEHYNVYSFDYTTFDIPAFDNEEVVLKLVNAVEYLLTSSLEVCSTCLNQQQVTTLREFISNRKTKEGVAFVLQNKLKERFNFMAAFQLLGAYQKYHYSIEDLEKRSFLADNNWLGEVARREKQGQASAITSHNGYEQYVAYYGTNSAFFLGFQYLKMYGDVLEFDVIGKAIGAYQKVLSKNFRKLNLAKPKKNVPKEQPNQPTKGDSQQPENFAETLDNLSDDYNRIIRESEVLDNVEWVKGRKTSGDAVNYHLSKKPFNKNGFKPPYKANSMVEDVTVEVNEKVYCVETLDAQRPGGWLTDKPLNSLDEVRDKLALIEDFKSSKDKLVIREYRVKKAFNTRKGIVGEQYETKGINAGKEYQGGANQIEFGAYMKNWTDYFEEVSKLSDNVNRAYIIKLNFND